MVRAARARPRVAWNVTTGVALLAVAVVLGWRWYQNQPRPLTIAYEVEAPAATCYDCDPPQKPRPLRIAFAASVAPLERAGKDLDARDPGVTMSPVLAGTWHWNDDRTLLFQPAGDWPVGQSYRVEFDRKKIFPPEVRLARDEFEFASAPFTAQVANVEFHQDPQVPTDKKAVIALRFSHPVDPAALERNLSLTMYERVNDSTGRKLGARRYSVVYDKTKLDAYVHSENLPVPDKPGRLEMKLGRDVRSSRGGPGLAEPLRADVAVPALDSLAVQDLRLDIARDERNEPRQVLFVETSASVLESALPGHVHAWLLPLKHPDPKLQAEHERRRPGRPFPWDATNVTNDVRAAAEALPLEHESGETDHYTLHGFRYRADPGRHLWVEVDRGLRSFGGYRLGAGVERLLEVPEFPRELAILHQGSLLPMSGSRTLTVFSRNVPAFRVEVGRVLPRSIQTLVTQASGDFSFPQFSNWAFSNLDVTERFTRLVRVPVTGPAATHYEAVDLGAYLADDAQDRRGLFLVRVQAWDETNDRPLAGYDPPWNDTRSGTQADARLVILTDLGLISKRARDGSFDVFVQSIADGTPVAGATVEVIGRNGLPVANRSTGEDGRVHFDDLTQLRDERQPVLFLARLGGDSVFLPVEERDRALDFSRFDVGGAEASSDGAALTAYLFSDRGIYRPGERIQVAALVRSEDWQRRLEGVPLQLDVVDPRGTTIRRETFVPGRAGFSDVVQDTRLASPTGLYTFAISMVRKGRSPSLIGSTTVRVRDFQPDRLRMHASFSAASPEGWVSPEGLEAKVQLDNLFGTPAANRRVQTQMTLTPSIPSFRAFPDYQFHDPQYAKEGMSEALPETTTDASGRTTLSLNLQRFARATYRVQLVVQGFEADGGRGVTAEAAQLVSSMPYLVGYKPDGALGYLSRGAARSVHLLAIDPQVRPRAVEGLTLSRVEIRYVSVLMRQPSGVYKYESRRKEIALDRRALAIPANGAQLALATDVPGTFAWYVRDAAGTQLARIEYQVAGDANVTRQLEKNAELELNLSRPDYAPGAEIEVSIRAPYAGAGLLTIEREKVYAAQWFRTDTTSSVQRIRLPEGLEGNAYVTVTFVRDPGSDEIYSSPLSYGVRPFSIATDARRTAVTLQAPALVKPGQVLKLRYRTEHPTRLVVFAVDEGILQVARYQSPDPLGHFFRKRALGVRTSQILDLVLPEFRQLAQAAAPGGDAEGLIGRNLNPFRRKGEPPVAFWSGIVEADSTTREIRYPVPDYFNGSLRVFAIAASDERIGVAEGKVTVRGDFVMTPVAPLTVTPGDEFDVSTGIANNLAGSGAGARVRVALAVGAGLHVVGAATQEVAVAEGREGSARFRVKVLDRLGAATLGFTSSLGAARATRTIDLSIRPATPYMTSLAAGALRKGSVDVPLGRTLYPQYREQKAGQSTLPLQFAHGFAAYLARYPYVCTEQLVSQAMPATLLAHRPEFGYVEKRPGADLAGLVDELRQRQNDAGAYRLWPGAEEVDEFVSVYAQHWLVEARERGQSVPDDLLRAGNARLRELAARDGNSLADERNGAYAIYLLTRQGRPMTAEIAAMRRRLTERYARQWPRDLTAAWLAASLAMMKQEREALALMKGVGFGTPSGAGVHDDPMTRDGLLLFLLARHFPSRLDALPVDIWPKLAERITRREYHSLSAGTTLLALDAWATATTGARGSLSISLLPKTGAPQPLPLPAGPMSFVDVGDAARALRFTNDSDLTSFYVVEQSGYDRAAPTQAIRECLEVLREYTDAQGRPLTKITMGQEVTVRLKFRRLANREAGPMALVDLLPGGFELVVPPQAANDAPVDDSGADEGADEGAYVEEGREESAGPAVSAWRCLFCAPDTTAELHYGEMREDRVVFYGVASTDLREVVYRIKATNAGTFSVPPAFGEAMYDRGVLGRSTGTRLTIERP